MSTFDPTDLFLLQRPSDSTDPYKAVTRESMRALGIVYSQSMPSDPDQGQLWCEDTRDLFIYNGTGWQLISSITKLDEKVSKIGDSMTGDLVMLGNADINFPVNGGLTLGETQGNVNVSSGHMVLVSYDTNIRPQGFLTIPSPRGGLDSIAKWTEEGLHVLKDPAHHSHATHKKYVDDENHDQDLIIEQNATNIIALFDDLESVRPSTVRTKYNYTIPSTYGNNSGEGRIYFGNGTSVVTAYNNTITEIYFNTKANNGIVYDVSTVTEEFYVEIQDIKSTGILLAEVVTVTDDLLGNIKIELNVIRHRDDGELVGDPDPTEVRLLIFKKSTEIDVTDEDRFAKLDEPNIFTKANTFKGPGVYIDSVAPLPSVPGFSTTNIFSVLNGATGVTAGTERFKINSKGEVTAGTVPLPFMAQYDNDVVTKKYVDERMARVGAYYGDTPPVNPVPGMLWYDTKEEDLTMYMFYENPDNTTVWTPVYSPTKGVGAAGSGLFVEKSGSTMTGPLIVEDTIKANKVETLVVDSGENSNLLLKHNGNTKVYVGGSQVTLTNPLKLNTEGTDEKHAVTKKYIDDKDKQLDDKLETFKDDLEAISPILVRGQWNIDHISSAGRAPAPGFFALYKIASDYEFITNFIDTHEVWIPEQDMNNILHDFTEELVLDKYIYIYDSDDKDYVLAVITSLQEEIYRSNKYYKLIVKPVQAKGLPHDDDTCYIKIFDPPTGGDGSQFVTKSDFAEVTDPLISTILELTYKDTNIGTDDSEINEFSFNIYDDYTEIFFRIEHANAAKAAYEAKSVTINGVDYEVNYYEENENRGWVEIDTVLTPEGFDTLGVDEKATFVLPKVCCYDDRNIRKYIDDYNDIQDQAIWDINDQLQQDLFYPVFKGTIVADRREMNSAGQVEIIYDDGFGGGYNIAIFGTVGEDVCAAGDKMSIDFGDGVFKETTEVQGVSIYDKQYTFFRFGTSELVTPLPDMPAVGTKIQIKFPDVPLTKSYRLTTMIKDAVEASTDFDSLKSNLLGSLDNYLQGN